MPTLQYATGFEHGVLDSTGPTTNKLFNTVYGPPSISTTTVNSGARSLRCNPTGARHAVLVASSNGAFTGGGSKTVVSRFSFRYASTTSGTVTIWAVYDNTNGRYARLQIVNSAGTVTLRANGLGGATADEKTSSALSSNTWYDVDVRVNASADPWVIDWAIDGTPQTQSNPSITAAANLDFMYLGMGASDTLDHFYDDWAISSTSGDYPLGALTIGGLSPNGVGTHNLDASPSTFYTSTILGGGLTSGDTTSYQDIDDVAISAGSDTITCTGASDATDYAEYQLANTAGVYVPVAVSVVESAVNGVGGGASYTSRIADSGSTSDITTALNIGTTRSYKYGILNSKPSGGAWTVAAADAMTYRWGLTASATNGVSLHAVIAEVVYGTTPAQTPPYINVTIS